MEETGNDRTVRSIETIKAQLELWGVKDVSIRMARKFTREVTRGRIPGDAYSGEKVYYWKYDQGTIGVAVRHAIQQLPDDHMQAIRVAEKAFHGTAESGTEYIRQRVDNQIRLLKEAA